VNAQASGYISVYLWSLTGLLAWLVVYQYAAGRRVELFSFRNVFLAGFALFQLHSVARVLWVGGDYGGFVVYDPYQAGVEFAWLATVFLVVFLVAYQRGWIVRKIARRIPSVRLSASPTTLLTIAAMLTFFAFPMRFIGIPGLGFLAKNTGTGMTAVAAGIVAWVLTTTSLKPTHTAIGGGLIVANLLTSVWMTFGRRPLVGVLAAVMWTGYYARWRFYRVGRFVPQLLVLGIASLLTVALYTTVRREFSQSSDPLSVLAKGDAWAGLASLSTGQLTGVASLWVIENYPERFETRPLMTLRYMVLIPVPRVLWPNKPEPLSHMMVTQADIPQRSEESTIPPGVIGYAAAEGGLYAAIAYALFLGLLLGFLDEYVRTRVPTPFVIAPTAAALGQVVGIPRGDVSIFTDAMVFTTLVASLGMIGLAKVIGRRSSSMRYRPMERRPALGRSRAG
jgi:hypothetical protein